MKKTAICLGLVLFGLVGCYERSDPRSSNSGSRADRPVAPLTYTERPGLSPSARAIRERRLIDELIFGAKESGSWGNLRKERNIGDGADSPEALGRAIFSALVEKKPALWEAQFISPSVYAELVNVDSNRAEQFVHNIQSESAKLWDAVPIQPKAVRKGGLENLFGFQSLDLGRARDLDGTLTSSDQLPAQFWNNELVIGIQGTEVAFAFPIDKIIARRSKSSGSDAGEVDYFVASKIEVDPTFERFIDLAMYKKSSRLRSSQYPIPLSVGTFWHFERDRTALDSAESPDSSKSYPSQPEATHHMVEVVSVERRRFFRLVSIRHSFDDPGLTRLTKHWLLLPEAIVPCNDSCRDHLSDLSFLLTYLTSDKAPCFRFPLSLGRQWPTSSFAGDLKQGFSVESKTYDWKLSAGTFVHTKAVHNATPHCRIRGTEQYGHSVVYFARSKGIVKRVLIGEETKIVERLTDYRIMP